ncbi:MAG: aminotransferase class I/II-fold pyridoxal phosphate-dependent enzyme [Natronomonas sp.]|jgi:aminotransferase|uniref:pyridoxal phosphate-dependent aminotransferase n=1 Tax=Natronomonas sp. TaxID=2184060 RepID=UPI002870402A|nr:aminotransferase class I/II-fold pyridoxal phosphate-dependent enzyme [Natronomonas sp.]MDR9381974.1 aminotransferase class I/II-fold pyridoxal phosphate-dependent enzyme [Natronomonas sp.]MDR9429520.1 aminotransferase class I/II-fold pyridoxal phosphate-dependent enzyme [Natronomonas sp.]
MSLTPSERVADVPPSGIRRFFELAEEMDDVISLGVGEPDFSTPWSAREAAITSLERGQTSYTANRGKRELREEIASDVRRWNLEYDPDTEILVTAGASEAIDLAFRALVDPGDTVAVVQPSYVSYVPGVTFSGGEVLDVPTRVEDEFKLTPEVLSAAGAEVADLLVYCYPNNPTGATMNREELAAVADFCLEHDVAVLADEIYADLTYEGDHVSIAEFDGMRERTVVFNGFSKSHAMTGLRLGYALGPEHAIAAMNRVHQYTMLSAPTTAQHAGIEALRNCREDVVDMRTQYDRRRRFVLSRFSEMGIDCFEATGAFYVFPECPGDDAEQFAEDLLEAESVAMVPGNAFGVGADGHLRASYATGLSDLKEAMDRLERFVS